MSQQHRPPHLFPGRSGSMKPEQQQQQLPQVVTHANATLGGGLPSSVAVGLHAATTAPPFGLSSNGQSRIFPSNLTTGSSFSLLERIQAAQIPADQANLLLAQLLTQQQQPLAAYVPSFNPVQQATKQFNATTSHVAPFAVAASLQQPHHQEQHLTTGAANPFQEQLRQLHSVSRSLVAARRQEEPYLPPVLATAASALPSGRVPVMITHTAPSDKKPAANTSALSAKVEEQTAPTVAKHASPAKPSSKSSGKAAAPDKPKRPLSAYNLVSTTISPLFERHSSSMASFWL